MSSLSVTWLTIAEPSCPNLILCWASFGLARRKLPIVNSSPSTRISVPSDP